MNFFQKQIFIIFQGFWLLLVSNNLNAITFDSELKATVSVKIDAVSSILPSQNTTQTAIYTLTQAGTPNVHNINALTATPALPLQGTLTDITDGIEIQSQSTGIDSNAHSALLTDIVINLQNTSNTRTLHVDLLVVSHLTAAVNGADVSADAKTTLMNGAIKLISDQVAQADVALGLPNDSVHLSTTLTFHIAPQQNITLNAHIDIQGDTNLLNQSIIGDRWNLSNLTQISLTQVVEGFVFPVFANPAPASLQSVPVPVLTHFPLILLVLLLVLLVLLHRPSFVTKK